MALRSQRAGRGGEPGAIDWCTRHLASDGYSCVWVKLLVVA
ncbi:hypothetical protein I548_3500 [Mycobacterium intracellulare]|nr:hypothetical protein I548_3500 [Mycobacterium intracellulare]